MDIVILHGWGQNKHTFLEFKRQLEALSEVKHVYAIDLPGFGTQNIIDENWSIPEYTNWVDNQIMQLKKKNIVLIGHSFGGRIAAYLASTNPSYLAGLILSGAPVLYRPSLKVKTKNRLIKSLKKFLPAQYKSLAYSQELKDAEKRGLGKILRNVIKFDQTKYLPLIHTPTLLIWGELDLDAPVSIAIEAKKLITNSRLEIIKKGEHNSFHSHPYIFFGYVKEFLKTI